MVSGSQAPHVFGPPEKNIPQSLHHQTHPISVYNDRPFHLGPDLDGFGYSVPGLVQEEPVSTGLTLDQDYLPPFAPDHPTLHQESDLSAITASSGTVESSSLYDVGDSESELSFWSFNNPSNSTHGGEGKIQGDYSWLTSRYEEDDRHTGSDPFLPESIELESMQRISVPLFSH